MIDSNAKLRSIQMPFCTERLIQKGFEKGALEVAREIACRLRDMGWPPERIQEATGLSGEELKKLFPDEQ